MNPLARVQSTPQDSVVEEEMGPCAVLRLEGELGAEELCEVGAELFRQVARGRVRLVLDLSAVPHLDYRGVKHLSARTELLRDAGGDLKLACVSRYLEAILAAGGGHKYFEQYPTVDSALAAFAHTLASVA